MFRSLGLRVKRKKCFEIRRRDRRGNSCWGGLVGEGGSEKVLVEVTDSQKGDSGENGVQIK